MATKLKNIMRIIVLVFFSITGTFVFAYNPPAGGEQMHTFFSPSLLGGQTSVTGGAFGGSLPGQLSINPALSGMEQRPILDVSYMLLAGIKPEKGFGHAFNLGVLYPASWGVLAGNLNVLNSEFASMPLGTAGDLRLSYAKDLTEKLSIGVGTYVSVGKNWGLGADLGILYNFGDLSFLKNSKLGVSLTGIGKTYNPKTEGVKSGAPIWGYPGMFTPHIGFASTLVSVKNFKLGMNADMSFPTFQNLTFDTGLHFLFADMVSLKTGWNFNLVETLNKKQTYIPSFGIGVNIKIKSKTENSFVKKQGWEQSEITPEFAVKPFYKNIWAFGMGINTHFGTKDLDPPKIEVTAPQELYFSPNDDGTQDAMELPFKITDKRYITSWSCDIKNEKGETVRQIANKEPLREIKSAKSFFKLIGLHKNSVEVPPTLRWDGYLDSGEIAPDGRYTFTVTSSDDNKNTRTTESYVVYVDKTPPEISITEPSEPSAKIFSPDNDGNKDTFTLTQKGSYEDLWLCSLLDSKGNKVKTFEIKNGKLQTQVWDGKGDDGLLVPDGLYTYIAEAKDKAGNYSKRSIQNIIVDTEKPDINIIIDKKAFSPNGDGVNDTITLHPSIPITRGLTSWKIEIKDDAGKIFSEIKGASANIKAVPYDGKVNGASLPEGTYKAVLYAKYENGFSPSAQSPSFILDLTTPSVSVTADSKIFSPDGDGKIDTVKFKNTVSAPADEWTVKIYKAEGGNVTGSPVYSEDFADAVPAQFTWNGRTSGGILAEDGQYAYVVEGSDKAGNTGISNICMVELNTEKADIILQADNLIFSPNGDKKKDFIEFYPIVKSLTEVSNYRLSVFNAAGTPVKTFTGAGKLPKKIIWDGSQDLEKENAPDGQYSAAFEVELENKQTAKSVIPQLEIDTKAPEIQISVPYLVFSPGTNAGRDVLPVAQTSSIEDLWTASVINSKNMPVKTFKWQGNAPNFEWNADDDSGNKIPDGGYTYKISSEDKAGNSTEQVLTGIVVDSRVPKAYIAAQLKAFSPNGDGIKDSQKFTIHTNVPDGIESWSLFIRPDGGSKKNAVYIKKSQAGNDLPSSFVWDGKDLSGKIAEGHFSAELEIKYKKGDKVNALSSNFISTITPPQIGVTLKPKYFSPDNDGTDDDLFVGLKVHSLAGIEKWAFEISEPEDTGGQLFWKTGGTDKITEQLIWDGRSVKGEVVQSATDYPFTFTVKDEVGLSSVVRGYIPVDILLIVDGDKLKIAVPSIIFRPNAADFKSLPDSVVGKNNYVLKRVAQILNKFPEYQVQVEGHANTTTGTQKEEINDLLPLSNARAKAVKEILIQYGVKAGRLSSVGMGSSKPVASLSDKQNWWKNRRVEFVLIKK